MQDLPRVLNELVKVINKQKESTPYKQGLSELRGNEICFGERKLKITL